MELTAKLGESEARMRRLENLQSVADGLRKGAEVRAETMRYEKYYVMLHTLTFVDSEGKRRQLPKPPHEEHKKRSERQSTNVLKRRQLGYVVSNLL